MVILDQAANPDQPVWMQTLPVILYSLKICAHLLQNVPITASALQTRSVILIAQTVPEMKGIVLQEETAPSHYVMASVQKNPQNPLPHLFLLLAEEFREHHALRVIPVSTLLLIILMQLENVHFHLKVHQLPQLALVRYSYVQ